LEKLSVFKNLLDGDLPQELTKLVNMVDLNFAENKFTGIIPAGFADLPNLKKVHFDDNLFYGTNLSI
jgi:hypothetical protein